MEEKTDLRIIKTQKSLCDAFLALMSEKPFDDITVGELCDRALVRRATFYKHFADKYDFFSFFIRQTKDSFIKQISAETTAGSPFSYNIYISRMFVRFVNEHEKLIQNILTSNALSLLIEILSDEIYRSVLLDLKEEEQHGTSFAAPVEILAAFYAGGIIKSVQYWFTNGKPITEEALMDAIATLLESIHLTEAR